MKTDAYFEIGHSHSKCDDYALSGTIDNISYAIVSDGCTGSLSTHTDVGARLLCLIARDVLIYLTQMGNFSKDKASVSYLRMHFSDIFNELFLRKISEIRALMNLEIEVFDATLLMALSIDKNTFAVLGWGDGTYITKYKNRATQCVTIEYNPNQPYYPSYALSPLRSIMYSKSMQNGTVQFRATGTHKLNSDAPIGYPFFIVLEEYDEETEEICEITQLVVSTDGISSFQYDPRSDQYQENSAVFPVKSVFKEATDYKVLNGPFVQRRMQRMALLNSRKRIVHMDDLAMAAISLE
jgi:hypothetical protein